MRFNHDKFIELCGGDKLKEGQRSGLLYLLDCFENDEGISDIRWTAYMLATIERECAGTYKPIREYGQGKGRPYGTVINGRVYFGRGFVQLTWIDNYAAMSKVAGVDLVDDPSKACELEIAYKIMSYGMRHGSFTGVGLPKYINAEKCDYLNARKIINGMDHAEEIAKVAEWFENVLRECEL